jgi:hypothetical protein
MIQLPWQDQPLRRPGAAIPHPGGGNHGWSLLPLSLVPVRKRVLAVSQITLFLRRAPIGRRQDGGCVIYDALASTGEEDCEGMPLNPHLGLCKACAVDLRAT